MADFEIDERVDITDVVCPMTFVKAKVAIDVYKRQCQYRAGETVSENEFIVGEDGP